MNRQTRLAVSTILVALVAAGPSRGREPVADPPREPVAWRRLPPLPDPCGVAGPFAGIVDGGLVVAGGANFPDGPPWEGGTKVWHDVIWRLDHEAGTWRDVGRLPRRLAYGVSVTVPDGLVCVGGSDADGHAVGCFRLAITGDEPIAHPLPDLPRPLANACGGLVGTAIYVCGGTEAPDATRPQATLRRLDLAADDAHWVELADCPGGPRLLATAAVSEGAFYVIGGADLEPDADGGTVRRYRRDAWAYEPARGWRRCADLPTPLVAAPSPAPVLADGRVLLVGGDTGTHVGFRPPADHPGFSRRMLVYDPRADRWQDVGEAAVARVTVPVVQWHDRFVITSGEARPGVRSPEVWSLRPEPRP